MVSDEWANALYPGTRITPAETAMVQTQITALNCFLIAIKDASFFGITEIFRAELKHSAFARRQQSFLLVTRRFYFRTDCGEIFTLSQRRFLLTVKRTAGGYAW